MKHTPGPWSSITRSNDEGIIAYIGPKNDPAYMAKVFAGSETGQANARLIAAAPELLEALRFLTDCFKGQTSKLGMAQQAGLIKAFEAIAKARGES